MSSPRIITGSARGKRLLSVPGDITRPITDRVKEALFNILQNDIDGTNWLDMFGGTGSVGIEALSRGARFVRFLDLHRAAVNTIKTNLTNTKLAENAEVIMTDSLAYLRRPADQIFDYIFIAPPQYKKMWLQSLQELDRNPAWIGQNSLIIVQIDPVEYEQKNYEHFKEYEQRKYGSTLLVFYEPVKADS